MISKFFIERPVLANVLAITDGRDRGRGAVSAPGGAISERGAATIQVTTRYPGAERAHVVDTVALPIEQQVNGVDGMIYMQSYSAADGSYTLTVTFPHRHGHQFRAGAGAEPGVERARPAAAAGAGARRHRAAKIDGGAPVRDADISRLPLRQPVPGELRHHQS